MFSARASRRSRVLPFSAIKSLLFSTTNFKMYHKLFMHYFNKESTPKRLGNWQVPRWAPTRARPMEMRPNPKPICDLNGHFLPGAPRGSSRCFGHFTGTWDLPRKITRKVAEELAKEPPDSRFPDWINLRVQRPKAASRMRGGKRGKEKEQQEEDEQSFTPKQCPYHKRKH
ncbi:protein Flattop homolog isoform X1 [Danaus plexippus]|uniref:protein Flattop homolog isoform X1 n=1 Tax=Danaus plexippus TaxID=13037 RepID=UPI002AB26F7B|nr:protein Flattop homolog isoform X1 [Danaus plexippus]